MRVAWAVCHRCLGVADGGVCLGCGEEFCDAHLTADALCEACFTAAHPEAVPA